MKSENYQNFNILHFHELESTNKTSKEMALNGEIRQNTVVISNIQTSGRGRLDRKWSSNDEKNLYFSIILQPKIEINHLQQLIFVTINSLKDAIFELFSAKNLKNLPKINKKWPNDLLINDKKVAGILLESLINGNECDFVIIGIGVNIESNPKDTIFPASNLKDFSLETDKNEVLHKFLDKFTENYQNFLDFGFKKVKSKYIEDVWRLNEEISINSGEQKNSGIFTDINENGDILLKQNDGIITISVGDVS